MSEQTTTNASPETLVVKEKMTLRGLAWRTGCVVIWLPLILLPIVMFNLATSVVMFLDTAQPVHARLAGRVPAAVGHRAAQRAVRAAA